MTKPQKMLLARCPHCGVLFTYDYFKVTEDVDSPPMYFRHGCKCGEEFDLHLLTGVTYRTEYPGNFKKFLTVMDTILEPAAKLDHYIEFRWGHPLGVRLQEWLHVSKYHLTLYSMTAGIVLAAVDLIPLSLFSAFVWVLICLPTLMWSYQKVRDGAGEDEGSGDAATLNVQDMLVMKLSRFNRYAPLAAIIFGIPLRILDWPDPFTLGMFLVYSGLMFATIPYVPPSKRKVWFPQPKLATLPT